MKISPPKNAHLSGEIKLPASKSISNRLLILKHLHEPDLIIDNLSNANDTVLLQNILSNLIKSPSINDCTDLIVQDAGTAFRFLTAFCAITEGNWRISGTERLHQRPISELVEALRIMGADIEYEISEGYAPLRIKGKSLSFNGILDMRNVSSSQFISAIIMIAPLVKGDWKIQFSHQMSSLSFMYLTLKIMRRLGFTFFMKEGYLQVHAKKRFEGEYFLVEPDWTSFYYWFSLAHLCESCDFYFPGLSQENIQTEKEKLFTISNTDLLFTFDAKGLRVQKQLFSGKVSFNQKIDFKNHPDLATCFAVLCMALRVVQIKFVGLESLKYKESDREQVVHYMANKMGCSFSKQNKNWVLKALDFGMNSDECFEVFDDHRIAMSLAPLALLAPIQISDPRVVIKSYPDFWKHWQEVGFGVMNEV